MNKPFPMKKHTLITSAPNLRLSLSLSLYFCLSLSLVQAQEQPKLILQITVDQLRADLPTLVYDRLPEGGV